MKKSPFIILSSICTLLIISCEKEVDFNLPASVSEKVVVEGGIEINTPPIVRLTNSFGFFSKLDLNTLQDAFISGAVITVSDDQKSIQLREYTIDTFGSVYKFYSVDTANLADLSFLGQAGKSYHLKISLAGQVYESTTQIPLPVTMDSIWSAPFMEPVPEHPEYRKVVVKYTDPPVPGNRYRVYVSKNNGPYFAPRFSTFDDAITNGTSTELEYYNVLSPMDTTSDIGRLAFVPGDTVSIKFSAIDKPTYDFWSTLDFSVGSTGNPFSTPIKVPSTISNGALGVWAGYAPSIVTTIITD